VLRGGSWINNSRNARCAYRNNNDPDNFNNNVGFRVVVAHDFRSGILPGNPGVQGRRTELRSERQCGAVLVAFAVSLWAGRI
jgi:hypothetical protein